MSTAAAGPATPPDALGPARELERRLGDPEDPTVEFSFARSRSLDEREEFPEAICAGLTAWGLHRYFVPPEYGGALRSYEELLHLVRLVARRDLTVAIGYGKTFLGAVSAWVAGTPEQCADLAERVLAGTPVAWALTERDHGSDLLAGEVVATRAEESFRLTGEKWLINNATRGRLLTVLARTDPAGGARGFDLLLVDKERLGPDALRCLPKVRTLGIRGADISGVAFAGAVLPAAARLGPPGSGLETVLRGLQLTRTMCAALSLGAGEHALRIASAWAGARRLYGRVLADLPAARRVLLDAYADQLAAEATAVVAARMIHWLPGELSVASAAVKYLLPVRTEASIAALGRLLGARSIFADGDFQKVGRDARIVSLFDGSTVVNLHAVVSQFPNLVRGYRRPRPWSRLRPVADLRRAVPPFDRERLALAARDGLTVLAALPDAARVLAELALARPGLTTAAELAGALARHTDRLHATIARLRPARGGAPGTHLAAAQDLARCYAGAAAVTLWLANHDRADQEWPGHDRAGHDRAGQERPGHDRAECGSAALWTDGRWLAAVLGRLLGELGEPVRPRPEVDEALWAGLTGQAASRRLFSLFECELAEGMGP
ncbi:acyl-CoA dehydrogenase family protein [Micromonospora sp. NPDC049559]|uniref:acyl-CoA dehydrogenase family protein n=1 Tax=Micromonospora sp. NPDC049559 TaxID=3155923 RepID=UPI0034225437